MHTSLGGAKGGLRGMKINMKIRIFIFAGAQLELSALKNLGTWRASMLDHTT